ncbi:hypothetical protein BCY86_03855 [Pajaroellobacter abortibovis]|uniref:Uncharacterized protein n=1 Tax=Pajaroellobacter abortibovis TaxID=1882918 RepID=A0A1L6MWI4_9BACT|nr:hypothetical protein BCY86_03855 [Pajaroellobacter abortibovis]
MLYHTRIIDHKCMIESDNTVDQLKSQFKAATERHGVYINQDTSTSRRGFAFESIQLVRRENLMYCKVVECVPLTLSRAGFVRKRIKNWTAVEQDNRHF